MAEFTGERVVPGQVDPDLWNEHVARYAFAARLAAGQCVLDAGCGSGYGAARLASTARRVFAIDLSAPAAAGARASFSAPNLSFAAASCEALPFPDGAFDAIISFEVIEHLANQAAFLREARRTLRPSGYLIVSTPNRDYYAESRKLTGPNPYHVHEFDYAEFADTLREYFPSVSLFLQNHVGAISFAATGGSGSAQLCSEPDAADPATANFFVAVCGPAPHPAATAFVYLPSTANVLRERELHIQRLEGELATKDSWLRQANEEKHNLLEMFRQQTAELERSNQWAEDLNQQLLKAQARIVQVQDELAAAIAGYESKVRELETENHTKTEWAIRTDEELKNCAQLLDTAEKTVVERTEWALRLEAQLDAIKASPLYKVARTVGAVPKLNKG